MGVCLSALVMCATRCSDRYADWKWDRDDGFGFSDIEAIHLQNATRPSPLRSIHTAVIDKNKTEIVRILSENPDAQTEVNSFGETALHLACKLGYINIVEVLIENGCSPGICTEIGTPLHCIVRAVKTGYTSTDIGVSVIIELVEKGCSVHAMDKGQKTALFLASEHGNYALMENLLSLGSAVNGKDINGFTPLYMAAIRGDLHCLNLILRQQDTEVDSTDEAGRTSLIASLITIMNNLRYERLPCDAYNMGNATRKALIFNRYNGMGVVEALIRAGANPNETDTHNRSALVIAFIILEMDNIRGIADQVLGNSLTVGPPQINHSCGLKRNSFTDAEMMVTSPESAYTPIVRLLVLSGASMPPNWDKDDTKSPPWLQQLYRESKRVWTENLVGKPYRLMHLARLAIRAQMAIVAKLDLIDKLPVPEKLSAYIQVKYY